MESLGSDFRCETDLTPGMLQSRDEACLGEALVRRLQTSSLWYDEDYGTDLREYVNSCASSYSIENSTESEILKDERVESVQATAEYDSSNESVTLTIQVVAANGVDFTLTVLVTALTVELLDFLKAA